MDELFARVVKRRGGKVGLDVTASDAVCVALAERLDCTLVTADRRLAATPGVTCSVEVLPTWVSPVVWGTSGERRSTAPPGGVLCDQVRATGRSVPA